MVPATRPVQLVSRSGMTPPHRCNVNNHRERRLGSCTAARGQQLASHDSRPQILLENIRQNPAHCRYGFGAAQVGDRQQEQTCAKVGLDSGSKSLAAAAVWTRIRCRRKPVLSLTSLRARGLVAVQAQPL